MAVTPMQPVRFGLVGYGAWGRHHARAITEAEFSVSPDFGPMRLSGLG